MTAPKKILTISGSSRQESSNIRLLHALEVLDGRNHFLHYTDLHLLPLFAAELDKAPWPEEVLDWRAALASVDAVVISTPEYIHNLPAQIKSALEWIASSGELVAKPIIAITYTPHEPRGERAMQSLLWSLSALEARVIAQVNVYQTEVKVEEGQLEGDPEIIGMLQEVLRML